MLDRSPPRFLSRTDILLLLGGFLSLAAMLALSAISANMGDALTRNTIRLSLIWYAAALLMMMQLQPFDWAAQSSTGKTARWCWTWGVICYLIHVGMAFHFFHDWSHADAYSHTQAASGFGAGIYGSYLFTAVWAADAVFWWISPKRYANRRVAASAVLHMLMLFFVFNGAVIFAQGPVRWASLSAFCVLAVVWISRRLASRPQVS